jgi:hypothetical protein
LRRAIPACGSGSPGGFISGGGGWGLTGAGHRYVVGVVCGVKG